MLLGVGPHLHPHIRALVACGSKIIRVVVQSGLLSNRERRVLDLRGITIEQRNTFRPRRDEEYLPSLTGEEGRSFILGLKAAHLLEFSSVVAPTAIVSPTTRVCPGVTICCGVILGANTVLTEGCFIGASAIFGHDVWIGSFSAVGARVKMAGHATVGECARIGEGATIIEDIRIGDGAVVAPGAVVLKDVKPNTSVAGVPARVSP